MADQRDSTDPNTPASMTRPSPPSSSSSGPDGQYTKPVRKGDIRVEPKLGADNYLTWAEEMWIQLKSMRVLKLVEGKTPQPDTVTRPKDFDEWDHDDTNALKWIRANCEKSQLTPSKQNNIQSRLGRSKEGPWSPRQRKNQLFIEAILYLQGWIQRLHR